MEANRSSNLFDHDVRRDRRLGRRFGVAAALALGWVGLQAGICAASPIPPSPPDDLVFDFTPPTFVPHVIVPEADDDGEVPPSVDPEVPSVDDLLGPDITIPRDLLDDPVMVDDDGADGAADDDTPAATPDDDTPDEGTPEDTPDDDTPADTPDDSSGGTPQETPGTPGDTPPQTTSTTSTTVARSGTASSASGKGHQLAYTGSNSALPVAGAGLVAAGGLAAGLSMLVRRTGARSRG